MILQNWWFTTLLGNEAPIQPPLQRDIRADVVIIGGGAGGLAAALRLMVGRVKKIVVLSAISAAEFTAKRWISHADSELELSQPSAASASKARATFGKCPRAAFRS